VVRVALLALVLQVPILAAAAGPMAAALTEARALVDQGKPHEALGKLALLDAADPRVRQLQGVAYYRADEPAKAVETLSPVVGQLAEGSMERREAVQVLGLSLYLAGRVAESIPYLEKTRAWAADRPELSYVLGNAYLLSRQPDKARGSFARLFGVSPEGAAGHLITAQMMVRLELDDPAEAELQKAIQEDPRVPDAHYLLGQGAIFRGQMEKARSLLQEELAVSPGDAMALYRLGDAYVREARWDEAAVALQKSIWLAPDFGGAYALLGRAYLKLGRPAAAEGMLRHALEHDPNSRSAHYLLGQILQQTGRGEDAKRELAIAEKLPAEPERR
jgi:tetratricopeptide (TPR) repeat protein